MACGPTGKKIKKKRKTKDMIQAIQQKLDLPL